MKKTEYNNVELWRFSQRAGLLSTGHASFRDSEECREQVSQDDEIIRLPSQSSDHQVLGRTIKSGRKPRRVFLSEKGRSFCLWGLVTLAVLFLTTSQESWADSWSESLIVGHLIKEGEESYLKRDLDGAIHGFSKVLLADPGNKTARQYLEKMGFKEGFYGSLASPVNQVAQLAEDLKEKAGEVDQYQQESTGHKQMAERLARQKEHLYEKLGNKDQKIYHLKGSLVRLREEMEVHDQRYQDLEHQALEDQVLNERLTELVDHQKKMQERILNKKEDQVDGLRDDVQFARAKALQQSLGYQDRIGRYQKRHRKLADRVNRLDEIVYRVKDKWAENLIDLEYKDDQIINQREELLGTEEAMLQTALDYEEQLTELKDDYRQMKKENSRQAAVQKDYPGPVQEALWQKDERIRKLQDILFDEALALREKEDLLSQQEQHLDQLSGQLKQTRGKAAESSDVDQDQMLELLKEKDQTIERLKNKLQTLSSQMEALEDLKIQLEEKDRLLKKQEESLNSFRDRFEKLQIQVESLEENLPEKDLNPNPAL